MHGQLNVKKIYIVNRIYRIILKNAKIKYVLSLTQLYVYFIVIVTFMWDISIVLYGIISVMYIIYSETQLSDFIVFLTL